MKVSARKKKFKKVIAKEPWTNLYEMNSSLYRDERVNTFVGWLQTSTCITIGKAGSQ